MDLIEAEEYWKSQGVEGFWERKFIRNLVEAVNEPEDIEDARLSAQSLIGRLLEPYEEECEWWYLKLLSKKALDAIDFDADYCESWAITDCLRPFKPNSVWMLVQSHHVGAFSCDDRMAAVEKCMCQTLRYLRLSSRAPEILGFCLVGVKMAKYKILNDSDVVFDSHGNVVVGDCTDPSRWSYVLTAESGKREILEALAGIHRKLKQLLDTGILREATESREDHSSDDSTGSSGAAYELTDHRNK